MIHAASPRLLGARTAPQRGRAPARSAVSAALGAAGAARACPVSRSRASGLRKGAWRVFTAPEGAPLSASTAAEQQPTTGAAGAEENATVADPFSETVIPDAVPAVPVPVVDLKTEVNKRRCFCICAHPDAGKTTLTEKLLLYGGAIHEAGEVRARRGSKSATSDWMEMEKQRGISISSTAVSFDYKGFTLNLLDTPGHADFSEDTYRTLSASDNAVMLIDAGKGLEPQTRKLFEVCRINGLPIFTFCNKMDRPSLSPLELCDQIEKEFKLQTYAVNWPIGSGDRFKGVYHRPLKQVHLFQKVASGSKEANVRVLSADDPALADAIGDKELYEQMVEEVALLDELGSDLDLEAVRDGRLTPVFFGSAANTFGVQLFLDSFLGYSLPPRPRTVDAGSASEALVQPEDQHFTGFVFKLQANMDPKHRDKVAFLRVCSGKFDRGMKVSIARTGKSVALSRPQKMFGQDRQVLDEGFAGDVIGLNNPGVFAIGDTLYSGPRREFPQIPSFSPELFATLRNPNTGKYKQFQKGVQELLSEGAVQCLTSLDEFRAQEPILAAVGELQFEVVQERMRTEYGVETTLDPLPFTVARWVMGGWPALEKVGRIFNAATVKDMYGRPVLLFKNDWNVNTLLADSPEIGELSPIGLPPTAEELAAMRKRA